MIPIHRGEGGIPRKGKSSRFWKELRKLYFSKKSTNDLTARS